MQPPRRPLVFLALLACSHAALFAAGCSATVETADGEAKAEALAEAPFVGNWSSELDGARLAVEPTGIFSVEVPARGETPARSVVGRWTYDGTAAVFTNLANSSACADVPGSYKPEVVRDTMRFELVRDECAQRQEHMAWPWKRTKG